jgi:hypothetical protein
MIRGGWVLLALAVPATARALPQYALASAHTCANCHVSPTYEDRGGWENPALAQRKCNLSCSGCHVDPSGGGLRTTPGRYFGESSLAMFPLQERSYSDLGRELFGAATADAFRREWGESGVRTSSRSIPSSFSEVSAGIGRDRRGGWTTFGKPLGEPSAYANWDGRYRDLNADPLLAIGGDLRWAFWSGSKSFFPMQLDLDVALHPIEHLTLIGTLAARGRVAGPSAVLASKPAPFFARNAFLMIHELPYMAYAKGGLFVPNFGTRIDDHTAFIRDDFDQDFTNPADVVLGGELGFAANYPYAAASFFRGFAPLTAPDGTDGGWGGALHAGWRDLGWSLGAHATLKRRPLEARGDLDAIGVSWGWSPWFWWDAIPLSLLGELSVGRRPRDVDGTAVTFLALYQEAWWQLANGLSVRVKYDLTGRDLSGGALAQRASLLLDLAPVPGVDLIVMGRLLWETGAPAGNDLFVQLHLWF